jgi:hypothetical protein
MERAHLWLGYTLIIVVVILTVFSIMVNLANNTSFEQKYYAKDISLLEQAAFASPYDVSILYSLDENYLVIFEDICSIRVNEKKTPLYSGSLTYCSTDNNLELIYPSEKIIGNFEIKKQGKLFEVKDIE